MQLRSKAFLRIAEVLGGYEGGEVASRVAVDVTLETYRASVRELGTS